ncbi:shugoshin 2 isoform X1 [Lepisosteus oculatus]|uniref:shugoshin 2 isoform X1 n=2 Tax=Lepisosteus oculatus TaxID=7918 RepID=UPI0035F52F51
MVSPSYSAIADIREIMAGKKQGPLKAAKLNLSLASKIKSKNINNSSIFKISLKNNNKALALALTAAKEKYRALETETVRLQREVQKLLFENASYRHRQSQLLSLLRTLLESTYSTMATAADLCSNADDSSDLHALRSECFSTNTAGTRAPSLAMLTRASRSVGGSKASSEVQSDPVQQHLKPSHRTDLGNTPEPEQEKASLPEQRHSKGSSCCPDPEAVPARPCPASERPSRGPSEVEVKMKKWTDLYTDAEEVPSQDKPGCLPVSEPAGRRTCAGSAAEPLPDAPPPPEEPPGRESAALETEMELTFSEASATIVTVESKPKRAAKKRSEAGPRKKEQAAGALRCAKAPAPPEKKKRKRATAHGKDAGPGVADGQFEPHGPGIKEDRSPTPKQQDDDDCSRRTFFTFRNLKDRRDTRNISNKPPENVSLGSGGLGCLEADASGAENPRKTFVISHNENARNPRDHGRKWAGHGQPGISAPPDECDTVLDCQIPGTALRDVSSVENAGGRKAEADSVLSVTDSVDSRRTYVIAGPCSVTGVQNSESKDKKKMHKVPKVKSEEGDVLSMNKFSTSQNTDSAANRLTFVVTHREKLVPDVVNHRRTKVLFVTTDAESVDPERNHKSPSYDPLLSEDGNEKSTATMESLTSKKGQNNQARNQSSKKKSQSGKRKAPVPEPLEDISEPRRGPVLEQSAVLNDLRKLVTEERPPWELFPASPESCFSSPPRQQGALSHEESPPQPAVQQASPPRTADSLPDGRVLKCLMNTNHCSGEESGRKRRCASAAVCYADPPINCKLRRGDKHTDTRFLSSPIYKRGKKHGRREEMKARVKIEGV